MRYILSLFLFVTVSSHVSAQKVVPFIDFSGFFKSFQDGFFRQIEFQRVREFKTGDDVVAYIDFRGNLRVFDGSQPEDISNVQVEYEVSDHLMIWKIGPTLNMWDDGEMRTLTYFADQYILRDSIIVFNDTRFNSVHVYYDGDIYELYKSSGTVAMPEVVGENIVAFRDNGNFNKVFWNGQIYELDVWHNKYSFSAGTDILAFNDPVNGTFAIFEDGQFLDVEDFRMNSYKAGRGFVVYENVNNDLMIYKDGATKKLTNFGADFYDVVDDVVIWTENGFTYGYANGQKIELAKFEVNNYKLKNNVIAFTNIMGGVDAVIDGKLKTLTTLQNVEFTIHGNAVLLESFNSTFTLYINGREYRD
ncbi:MAG: hypothetical protein HWE22_04525 [Flavobacteriales bacterium]|nr:hypothetical protein [Flavobacteriales bacterium]